MNRLGMMVDVSHPSKASMMQAVALSKAPIIASHSAVRALANHSRNMDDEQLLALKKNGGVVQIVAFAGYVKVQPGPGGRREGAEAPAAVPGARGGATATRPARSRAPTRRRRRSIRAARRSRTSSITSTTPCKLIGIDHVGISSDFDGGGGIDGWNSAAETFNVTLELVRRGYSEKEIAQAVERQPAARVARGREGREDAAGGGRNEDRGCWRSSLCAGLRRSRRPWPASASRCAPGSAMVIAQQPADEAGLAVLRKGGNAIDAAIAIGFALNAAYPYAGALGGGGFMLIRLADGQTTFIDFREQAPGRRDANDVPRRRGQPDARQPRGLAVVRRAGHGARLRAGAHRSTRSCRGPPTWRRRSSWRRRASRSPTRSPSSCAARAAWRAIRSRRASGSRAARSTSRAIAWSCPTWRRR